MATRCIIEVRDWTTYRIYRHCDGYPDGVLGDINKIKHLLSDAEYFLANFIFLAKYNALKEGMSWDTGYGVCSVACEHGDIEYKYILYRSETYIGDELKECWFIEIWHYRGDAIVLVYRGPLDEAIERFVKYFRDGCHIREVPGSVGVR